MADFLTRLAARTLGLTPTLRPLRPSRFEPGPEVEGEPEPEPRAGTAPPAAEAAPPPPGEPRPAVEAPRTAPPSPTVPELLVREGDPVPGPPLPRPPAATGSRSRMPERPPLVAEEEPPPASPSGATDAGVGPPAELRGAVRSRRPDRRDAGAGGELRPAPLVALSRPEGVRSRLVLRVPQGAPALRPVVAGRVPEVRAGAEPTAAASPAAGSSPSIQVTIGRIEVRAVTPPPAAAPSRPPPRGPRLSLDDYLAQRREGRR